MPFFQFSPEIRDHLHDRAIEARMTMHKYMRNRRIFPHFGSS